MSRFFVSLFVTVLTLSALAQAPLTITGISDRSTYTDRVSFSVPVTAGYSYTVTLDGGRIPAAVTNVVDEVDYHEVSVWRTNSSLGGLTNLTVRFIVQASTRGSPEKGLIVWTPYPPIPSTTAELAGSQLHLVAPRDYPQGLDIPVAAWLDDGQDRIIRGNGWITAAGFESSAFRLVRGHGSGFLPTTTAAGVIEYTANLAGLVASKQIAIETNTVWTPVSGTILTDTSWPANSRISLASGLIIPSGVTLTVGAGSIVKLGPLVNVTNSGSLLLEGTLSQPVVFTPAVRPAPERNTGAWGGIIMRGGRLVGNAAILTGGGGATSFNFSPSASHRSEQPLLLIHSGTSVLLTNCFLLNQAGQIMNGYNSTIVFDHCLLQRAITTGESVGSTITVNHSALIEFPSIDGVYNSSIADADYDGIYFTTGSHILKDSLVGFAKDDAIDSGSGGAGSVLVTNCWIESALHEALAWSGGGRQTRTFDTVLLNSGQGIEAGWTEGTGDRSPDCFADRLLATGNSVGARFGDNYDWTYYGFLRLTNSLLLYNYRDIFAKTWNTSGSDWNTNQWVDRLAQMDLRGNTFTTADPRFPSNSAWNTQLDGKRLASFMTTPTNAPVGIGFAVWTNRFDMPSIFGGIPVRLSSFTTVPVAVNYKFSGQSGELTTGTLVFSPGETLKQIFPEGFNLQGEAQIIVLLTTASGADITGTNAVTFTGTVAAPVASLAVAGTQLGLERFAEGVPVKLSTPAAHTVKVQYRYRTSPDLLLASGTLTFNPGETLKWVSAPQATAASLVRFDLMGAVGGTVSGNTVLYYIPSDSAEQPQPEVLLARGSIWKYLDDGSNQGIGWRQPSFSDQGWLSGPAELGFGDQDEATPIQRTNLITGTTNITFYFRSAFVVTNASTLSDLSLWLLRDDGGVVYLNGNEVFRSTNMPPGAVSYNTFTLSTGENSVDIATISATNLISGSNIAAVEIHQRDLNSSDVSFNFELIGNPKPTNSQSQELRAGLFDGELTLGWSDRAYVLEQANSVTGAWSQVVSPSPVSVTSTNAQMFFRLRR